MSLYVFKNSEMDLIFCFNKLSFTKFILTKVLEMSVQPPKGARQIYFYCYNNKTLSGSSFLNDNECLKKFIIKCGAGGKRLSTSDFFVLENTFCFVFLMEQSFIFRHFYKEGVST